MATHNSPYYMILRKEARATGKSAESVFFHVVERPPSPAPGPTRPRPQVPRAFRGGIRPGGGQAGQEVRRKVESRRAPAGQPGNRGEFVKKGTGTSPPKPKEKPPLRQTIADASRQIRDLEKSNADNL